MEVPIIAHRVRKAFLNGSDICSINLADYEFYFDQAVKIKSEIKDITKHLSSLLLAIVKESEQSLPSSIANELQEVSFDDEHRDMAIKLINADNPILLGGQIILRHPDFLNIRRIVSLISDFISAKAGYLTEGSNSTGASLTGMLPHKSIGGKERKTIGLDIQSMISSPRKVYITFGIDPEHDIASNDFLNDAFEAADLVVCFTSYDTPYLRKYADILIPIGTFAETPGSYINVEGVVQSFDAAASLVGDSKQGWRILRVLANIIGIPDSDYETPSDIREIFLNEVGEYRKNVNIIEPSLFKLNCIDAKYDDLNTPIYQIDPLVRRGKSLQKTSLAINKQESK
jgi:NADH-quinone oxidoreductase subunit G